MNSIINLILIFPVVLACWKSTVKTIVVKSVQSKQISFHFYFYFISIWLSVTLKNFAVYRTSCEQMFLKIGVLNKFAIFTGKHLCWSIFLIKLEAWNPANLFIRDSNTVVFLWIVRKVLLYLKLNARTTLKLFWCFVF